MEKLTGIKRLSSLLAVYDDVKYNDDDGGGGLGKGKLDCPHVSSARSLFGDITSSIVFVCI